MNDPEDDQGSADADGEAQDINHRENLIAAEIPQRDNQIVFEHGGAFRSFRDPRVMP